MHSAPQRVAPSSQRGRRTCGDIASTRPRDGGCGGERRRHERRGVPVFAAIPPPPPPWGGGTECAGGTGGGGEYATTYWVKGKAAQAPRQFFNRLGLLRHVPSLAVMAHPFPMRVAAALPKEPLAPWRWPTTQRVPSPIRHYTTAQALRQL